MAKVIAYFLAAAGLCLSAACVSSAPIGDGESVSIPYDPYDFDPNDLQAEADAHCNAFGLRAQFEDETVDPSSVRWRYRHYRCV